MNDTVVSAPEAIEPQTGIAEYSQTETGLAVLRSRLASKVYDTATTKGLTEAKADRKELRELRVNLEKLRKQLNEDDQARIATRNGKAKEITAQIVALEEPIDAQIKIEEDRKEQARIERERAEAERLRKINDEIANLERMPLDCISATASELTDAIAALAADELGDFDDVHLPTAQAAKDASLTKLREMLAARIEAEAETERLAAERAELDRLRAEQEQQRAAADAAALAERERLAEEARIQREREEQEAAARRAEQERIEAERRADEKAERERIAAEQAERQRQLDEQAAAQREAAQRAEQERRDREAAEAVAAAKAREEAEEAAIDAATLRTAAEEALALLDALQGCDLPPDVVDRVDLAGRKLAAALAKEPQA